MRLGTTMRDAFAKVRSKKKPPVSENKQQSEALKRALTGKFKEAYGLPKDKEKEYVTTKEENKRIKQQYKGANFLK